MKKELRQYLKRLRAYGTEHDIPNVTGAVGRFLYMMIKVHQPKQIIEIGCANGYSTIYMAEAARQIGSRVITMDHSAPTFAEAQKNLKEVGLDTWVDFHFGEACQVLSEMQTPEYFDFVFVDGQKASYLNFWEVLKSRLNPGAVLIWDDMMAFPEKTNSFSEAINELEGFDQLLIPIDDDDGILFMLKHKYEI